MAEFVAYARQNPGKLFYASGTAGNIIPSRILSDRLALGMTNVSYKSPPHALTDVVAGRVPVMALDVSAVLGQIRGGAVRPLAVTSLKEAAVLPGVPPLAETLPGFEIRASSPAELAAFHAREIERWAQLVKEAKIDPE